MSTIKDWFKNLFIQPPAHIIAAKANVDRRLTYKGYKSRVHGRGPVGSLAVTEQGNPVWLLEQKPSDLAENQANCVGYAKAYRQELKGKGRLYIYKVEPKLAKYLGQEWHCVLDIDGWRLDCMLKRPAKI